jgi:hypothetical protein
MSLDNQMKEARGKICKILELPNDATDEQIFAIASKTELKKLKLLEKELDILFKHVKR